MRTVLQFIADMIIKKMETANMDDFAKLYQMGMELQTIAFMTFAIELD